MKPSRRRRYLTILAAAAAGCAAPLPVPPPEPADTASQPVADTIVTPEPEPLPDDVSTVPGPAGAVEPTIRIGLMANISGVRISSTGDLLFSSEAGSVTVPALDTIRVAAGRDGLTSPDAARGLSGAEAVTVTPLAPYGYISVDGRPYRGTVVLRRNGAGLTAVNVIGLESYLAGVLPLEMGRLGQGDLEALKAQAVVSRTYALRNMGKRDRDGFDLLGTVADQVYGGSEVETPLAWRAVRETAGQVVTYQGEPIDAFFFSTCGGRTADGTEVYANADRPYLRSIADVDASGLAWCRESPRFRWEVNWSAAELLSILRGTLPPATGQVIADGDRVRGVRIQRRTRSDRAETIVIDLGNRRVTATGPEVRQVLRPAPGEILRSAAFDLHEEHRGGALTGIRAEGRGAGHGVGLCQWGAIGRARAGFRYDQILSAYYPGTTLTQAY
ncbi:MAG: SpoIID/LytB domain-containing protein [Gemmatimonadales bacterium]